MFVFLVSQPHKSKGNVEAKRKKGKLGCCYCVMSTSVFAQADASLFCVTAVKSKAKSSVKTRDPAAKIGMCVVVTVCDVLCNVQCQPCFLAFLSPIRTTLLCPRSLLSSSHSSRTSRSSGSCACCCSRCSRYSFSRCSCSRCSCACCSRCSCSRSRCSCACCSCAYCTRHITSCGTYAC